MGSKKQPNELLQNFKLAVIITIVLIVGGVAWGGVSHWLEDMKEEARQNHLNEVLVACTNQENSERCKSLQKKYNITFKYCYAMGDIDKAQILYLPNGQSTIVMPPKRAVVWEGDSSEPPQHMRTYHSCEDYQD